MERAIVFAHRDKRYDFVSILLKHQPIGFRHYFLLLTLFCPSPECLLIVKKNYKMFSNPVEKKEKATVID